MSSTNEASADWLGLDIGGANLKAAHERGELASVPFALWKDPGRLATELREVRRQMPPVGRVAVTMTAELCDCFATKSEGVRAVVRAVEEAFEDGEIAIWGTDGRFHTTAAIERAPALAAASNWLALAEVAARMLPDGPAMLVDIGSTTADLIPLRDGRATPHARDDTGRLTTGELVYAGVRRTPLMVFGPTVEVDGTEIGLAAELFATILDVFLMSGEIAESEDDRETADGRATTVENARARLLRMICADTETRGVEVARGLAEEFRRRLIDRLVAAVERRWSKEPDRPRAAVVGGSGEFLAMEVARRVVASGSPILRLSERWGADGSSSACARAVLELAIDLERP